MKTINADQKLTEQRTMGKMKYLEDEPKLVNISDLVYNLNCLSEYFEHIGHMGAKKTAMIAASTIVRSFFYEDN